MMSQVISSLYGVCKRLDSAGPDAEIDRQLELYMRALSKIDPPYQHRLLGDYSVDRSRSTRLRAISSAYSAR